MGSIIAARAAAKTQKKTKAHTLTKAQKNALHKAIKGQRKLATILGILAGGGAAAGVSAALKLRSRPPRKNQGAPAPQMQQPNPLQNPVDALRSQPISPQAETRIRALSIDVVRHKDKKLYENMLKKELISAINMPEVSKEFNHLVRLEHPGSEVQLSQANQKALAEILVDQDFPADFKQLLFERLLEWAARGHVELIRKFRHHGIMPTARALRRAAANETALNCLLENLDGVQKQTLLKSAFIWIDKDYTARKKGRDSSTDPIFNLAQGLRNIGRAGLHLTEIHYSHFSKGREKQKTFSSQALGIALHSQLSGKAPKEREPYLRNMIIPLQQAIPQGQVQPLLTAYVHKLASTTAPVEQNGAPPQYNAQHFSFHILKELAIVRNATMFATLETLLREAPKGPVQDIDRLLRNTFINLRAEILWRLARDYTGDLAGTEARYLIQTLRSADHAYKEDRFDISLEKLLHSNSSYSDLQFICP